MIPCVLIYVSTQFQISMGGMKYDDIKQCGKRCKELGPLTSVSLPPAATYEEVIEKAKEEFFYNSSTGRKI